MLKPFTVADQLWDRTSLTDLRNNMIQLRDKALEEAQMLWAIILSHNVAVLAHLIENMED